ncbi:ATP-binding protein [Nonomuraea mesophila]|uniref:ATP-binding protein n=1 Tax=Nonomuraea mesophila TaxID=2530382 RepID=A0A4R5FY93_9ACTN|nr:ATP-binding protein [Nonomuraea mesophila]TDE59931.1 ATP-binding protein [Nonomuraea mesophila]
MTEIENPARLPGLARRELRRWIGDHPSLADLHLIATELVTNAVVHGAGPWVRMSLRAVDEGERCYWRLAVEDPGLSASVPMPRMPGPHESRGRGLWIVDDLTRGCWATDRTRTGERVVWALLPREAGS